MRRLTIQVLFVMFLTGCGDSARVQRRQEAEPEPARAPVAADSGMPESPHGTQMPESPHGMQMPEAGPSAEGPEVDLQMVHLSAPKSWVRKQPASGFVLAEFSLPRADGDDADGRLTVSVAGGSIEDNIARWRGQFGKQPEKQSQEKLEAAGIAVTLVDFSGKYLDQRGMMGPGVERPNYRMLGAIFAAGGQMHFIKAAGPAKTMAARADEFRAFVRSLRPTSPPASAAH